jgi:hypothetical protein
VSASCLMSYTCASIPAFQRRGKGRVIVPTETMLVWEYLARVNGDASPEQIKAAIFKEHGNRVELQRISTLRRLWFECTGRETPPLRNGQSSVAATRTRKGKAKKVTSPVNKRTKK